MMAKLTTTSRALLVLAESFGGGGTGGLRLRLLWNVSRGSAEAALRDLPRGCPSGTVHALRCPHEPPQSRCRANHLKTITEYTAISPRNLKCTSKYQ